MDILFRNAFVYTVSGFVLRNVLIRDGILFFTEETGTDGDGSEVFDFNGKYIFPGLTDVHVHLREPGFSYKETIATGTAAAARGGFTTVYAMPNLNPAPDSAENLRYELDIIKSSALIRVIPYGTLTEGRLGKKASAIGELNCPALSDDGSPTPPDVLEKAMREAKKHSRIVCSHCEDKSLNRGGDVIADSPFARGLGIKGILPESEYVPLKTELESARATGCAYHLCHMSCKESAELIRKAKAEGLDVTCETAPHYIALDTECLSDKGNFRMSPPIRSPEDREAIIAAIADGTVDMIATDHAPHSADEKNGTLAESQNGVVGLETSFAVCYTELVRTGRISLERLVGLMSVNPKKRFGAGAEIREGYPAELCVFDLDSEYTVDEGEFLSMGKSTPFSGKRVFGRCLMTLYDGKIVWRDDTI